MAMLFERSTLKPKPVEFIFADIMYVAKLLKHTLKVFDFGVNNTNPYIASEVALQTPFFKFSDPPFRKPWIRLCNLFNSMADSNL